MTGRISKTTTSTRIKLAASCALALGAGTTALGQATIDNDLSPGVEGYLSASVLAGGGLSGLDLSGNDLSGGGLVTENVIFDYINYIDVGSGAFDLGSTATSGPSSAGDDTQVSSGSFTGSGGNVINWTVTSSIENGTTNFVNQIDFTAVTGTLGTIDFYSYLDEDVFDVDDDVFFTQGSAASNNLELFTLDGASGLGVAQSGAFTTAQGLRNATFTGWAADDFNDIQPRLFSGNQNVSPTGVIDAVALQPTTVPFLEGSVLGPNDIVSTMAWSVNQSATTATILSSLGGIPDGSTVPDLPDANAFEFTITPGEVITQSLYVESDSGIPLSVILLNGGRFVEGSPARQPDWDPLNRVWSWNSEGSAEGTYVFNYNISNGSTFDTGSITIEVVPEPSTAVALTGLLLIAGTRRRSA